MVSRPSEMVEATGRHDDPALVLASADWHGGVIGIVAGRLAEQYARPALMIALPAPARTAACRLGRRLGAVGRRLRAARGAARRAATCWSATAATRRRPASALLPENIDAFRERFCAVRGRAVPGRAAGRRAGPRRRGAAQRPDDGPAERPRPAGALRSGEPPAAVPGRRLAGQGEPRKVGGGERHLSFRVRQDGTTLKAIAFGMADRVDELMSAGGACCLASRRS